MRNVESTRYGDSAQTRLMDLLVPKDYLPPEECENGAVYWGMGRSIGEVAICSKLETPALDIGFEGLRNKLGEDFLFTEYHYDADPVFGTFRPFAKIANSRTGLSTPQKMDFLLEKMVEVQQSKVEWLENAPDELRLSAEHIYNENVEYLQHLLNLRVSGFCQHRTISFHAIMNGLESIPDNNLT